MVFGFVAFYSKQRMAPRFIYFSLCGGVRSIWFVCHLPPVWFVPGVNGKRTRALRGESAMQERAPAAFPGRQMDEVY